MSLKVYYDLLSQPSRAIVLFLKYNKIPYVDCPIALRKGEHFSDEFTKVNPLQKIPCIDDNGFKLTESVVILKYLAIKHKVSDHWYPKDFVKQIRVDEYMNWQHLNLRLFGGMYFRQRVIIKPLDEKRLEEWKDNLDTCLNQLETVYLAKGPFINGATDITIGDLLCVCELEQPIAAGYDLLANRPKIREYMDRVKAKLVPHYDPVNKFVRKLNEAVLKGKL